MPRPDHDLAWAMYHVVRSDRRLSFAQAMALGGAGAVACADRFRDSERWAANFAGWQAAAYPKVALRASAEQFAALAGIDAAPVPTQADPIALCMPPRRKSEREPQLVELAPFTDAKLPVGPPPAAAEARVSSRAWARRSRRPVMPPLRSPTRWRAELQWWRARGMPGEVRLAEEGTWERLKAEIDCVVIRDAGYTQVAAGTETVLAIPPREEQPSLVQDLKRVP
jgi:peptidyl-tRNA hydrolase